MDKIKKLKYKMMICTWISWKHFTIKNESFENFNILIVKMLNGVYKNVGLPKLSSENRDILMYIMFMYIYL